MTTSDKTSDNKPTQKRPTNRRRFWRRDEDVDIKEIKNEVLHPNPALRPAKRVWVACLFVLGCFAVAIVFKYLQDNFTHAQRSACNRANDVRRESNQRVTQHIADEQNLLAFLAAITHTRSAEAQAWERLNNLILKATPASQRSNSTFKQYENDVKFLIFTYQRARDEDAAIRKQELKIRFDKLPLVDCEKVTN